MKQDEKGGKRSADGFGESKHAGRLSGRATGDYPCAPTEELIQGFPVPPQNSPLAWQADPWYSRVDPGGQPWEVGLKLVRMGGDACVALAGGGTQAQEPDEGDATAQGVPSPRNPTPAPT